MQATVESQQRLMESLWCCPPERTMIRLMRIVEQLPGAWYRLWMDNLYTSWKFGEMLAARQCLFGGTALALVRLGFHFPPSAREAGKTGSD